MWLILIIDLARTGNLISDPLEGRRLTPASHESRLDERRLLSANLHPARDYGGVCTSSGPDATSLPNDDEPAT